MNDMPTKILQLTFFRSPQIMLKERFVTKTIYRWLPSSRVDSNVLTDNADEMTALMEILPPLKNTIED